MPNRSARQSSAPPAIAMQGLREFGGNDSPDPEAVVGGVEERVREQDLKQADNTLEQPPEAADLSVKMGNVPLGAESRNELREHSVRSPPVAPVTSPSALKEQAPSFIFQMPTEKRSASGMFGVAAPQSTRDSMLSSEGLGSMTGPSIGSIPAKRPLSIFDRMSPDETPQVHPTKRCARPATFGVPSLPAPSLATPSKAAWTPSVLTNMNEKHMDGTVWRNNMEAECLQGTMDQKPHIGGPPIMIKSEPQDTSYLHNSVPIHIECEADIFEYFKNHTLSSAMWNRLHEVQERMERYVAVSGPSESFDLVQALPGTLQISKKRRVELQAVQDSLDRAKLQRLRAHPGQYHSTFNRRRRGGRHRLRPDAVHRLQSHDQPAVPAVPAQAFNPFADPPARAVAQQTQTRDITHYDVKPLESHRVPPNEVSNDCPVQAPALLPKDVSQPMRASDPFKKSNKDQEVIDTSLKHSSLTILTLPRLEINQTPQALELATSILEEANSLLALYSDVRLAFSAQDMRHT